MTMNHRLIHDNIHGSFHLHHMLWLIIDTPEFQRLRNIKQNGNAHYVYIGATHTRFEHSIGVAYLAGDFYTRLLLKRNQLPDQLSKLKLQIAGLCHDIGHCAFSHLFDGEIIPYFIGSPDFTHEEFSIKIVWRLYYKLIKYFHKYSIYENEIKQICSMIKGKFISGEPPWQYQIISNSVTGVDVDKFDYLIRDSYNCAVPHTFRPKRLMEYGYISRDNTLEFEEHGLKEITRMWHSRETLHREVYQHRVVKCYDLMTLNIFKLVAPLIRIGNTTLDQVVYDLDSYLKVTDNILDFELANKNLLEVQAEAVNKWNSAISIYNRMKSRDLFTTLAVMISTERLKIKFNNCYQTESKIGDIYIYYFFTDQRGDRHCKKFKWITKILKLIECNNPNTYKLEIRD